MRSWQLGACAMTRPLHAAEEILDQFRDQFIKEMEAEKVTEELLHKDIISRGDQQTITRAEEPTLQNQILHRCLKEKCTLDALRSVCATIKAVKGNPKMAALGDKMMRRLETGVCVCVECDCVCICILNAPICLRLCSQAVQLRHTAAVAVILTPK